MNMSYDATIRQCDEWARPRLKAIFDLLPFNPVIARKAFEELLVPEKAGGWKEISNLFSTDPGLMSKFYEKAKGVLWSRRKLDRPIRNIEDAVSLLGIPSVAAVLESAMSDEIIQQMEKVPYVEMQLIWKESWGIGYAAERLAPYWSLDRHKALHIGFLADIGMLLLSQLFKIDYFLKADPMFQNGIDDIYESSGRLRLDLERAHFGVNHAELGCWLLDHFGLNRDYSLSLLTHEQEEPDPEQGKFPLLINMSRRVSRFVQMSDRFRKYYKEQKSLEIEHKFATTGLRSKYLIYDQMDRHFGIRLGDADRIIAEVGFEIDKHSENISGNISLLEEKDFLEALSSIGENRDRAIRRLAQLLDAEINNHLPQPVALLNRKLADPRAKALEYPSLITNLLSDFIRFLSSVSLCLLYYLCGQERKAFGERLCAALAGLKEGKLFLDMGQGVEVSRRIVEAVMPEVREAHPVALSFANYILANSNALQQICRMRKETKQGKFSDLQLLMEKINRVLTEFARLKANLYAVTGLEYRNTDRKTPFRVELIGWMDTLPVDLREPTVIKREQPMVSSEQGLFMHTPGVKAFQLLPEFLVYRRCAACKKKHFYLSDSLAIGARSERFRVSVRLAPVVEALSCPPVKWPEFRDAPG